MSFNIDHVVITVSDINKSIDFYSNILGMELQEFSSSTDNVKRKSLKFGNKKINLHKSYHKVVDFPIDYHKIPCYPIKL